LYTAPFKNHRNEDEYQVLVRLAGALPADITVRILNTNDRDRQYRSQSL